MTRSMQPARLGGATGANVDSRQVLRQFRQIFNAVKAHFRQVEVKAGLGGAQVWALGVIREEPGIGVTELARRMDVHPSTASNLVRGLVDRGLAAATKGEADRRSVQLNLLPAGVRALKKAPGPYEGVLPEALEALAPARLARLHGDLAVLIESLDVKAGDAHTPLAEL